MSIEDKLQKILNSKIAIKNAIADVGGTITNYTPLDEYANSVESVEENMIRTICDRSFTSVVIPDGVTNIKHYAFHNCTNLSSVIFPNSVTTISSYAFQNTGIVNLVLPPNITVIPGLTFPNNKELLSVSIPNGVTKIDQQAFNVCTKLPSINIPDSVTQLGTAALADNPSLVDIQIGTGITSIGNLCFRGCNNAILRIKATTPPSLSANAFTSGSFVGKIYVPDASVDSYKTATNWGAWKDYIYPLSEYVAS